MCLTHSGHKNLLKLLMWERGTCCAEENHLYQVLGLLHPQTQKPPGTQVGHLKARKYHNTQTISIFLL